MNDDEKQREDAIQAVADNIAADHKGADVIACVGPPLCNRNNPTVEEQQSCRICERIYVDEDGSVHRAEGNA